MEEHGWQTNDEGHMPTLKAEQTILPDEGLMLRRPRNVALVRLGGI